MSKSPSEQFQSTLDFFIATMAAFVKWEHEQLANGYSSEQISTELRREILRFKDGEARIASAEIHNLMMTLTRLRVGIRE